MQEPGTAVESELLAVNKVSEFLDLLPMLTGLLEAEALNFEGGRLQKFKEVSSHVTSDPEILSLVTGAKIEFDCTIERLPLLIRSQSTTNQSESTNIDCELQKLLLKSVSSQCEHDAGEVISPVFTRPRKD